MFFNIGSNKINFNFVSKRSLAFSLSAFLSIVSLAFIFFKGFNFGIDFQGGLLFDINVPIKTSISELTSELTYAGYKPASAQEYRSPIPEYKGAMIRFQESASATSDENNAILGENKGKGRRDNDNNSGDKYAAKQKAIATIQHIISDFIIGRGEVNKIESNDLKNAKKTAKDAMTTNATKAKDVITSSKGKSDRQLNLGPNFSNSNSKNQNQKSIDEQKIFNRIDYVGPKVGASFVRNAFYASIVALLGMLIYVSLRFQWQFSIGALLALAHDVIITLGFYSLCGLEFDLTALAAILTIVGYSINDSIVIYDRIREKIAITTRSYSQGEGKKSQNINGISNKNEKNNAKGGGLFSEKDFSSLINASINETLSRTLMTVGTTVLAAGILLICTTESLHAFCLTVIFGILFGTYSSIWISANILLLPIFRLIKPKSSAELP